MLRSNSRKAKENIREYIIDKFTPDGYDIELAEPYSWHDVACTIWEICNEEKSWLASRPWIMFQDWCSGLPSILDCGYYYNRSAVEDLGKILEETEEEKRKYSESEAERMLTHLMFREIFAEVRR